MATMTLDELVLQLKAAFGAGLRTVALYGSAAGGEHLARKSDYNVLVIVDALEASHLAAASATIAAWDESGNPPPLTLTAEEWRTSGDIFAMEYADILERHKLLHGTFPSAVRVDQQFLRLQLEREAMGALLQLRRGALAAGNHGKDQLALLERASSTTMVLLRAVLRLRSEAPPRDNLELCQRVASAAGVDTAPFERIVRHKRGDASVSSKDASAVLTQYLASVQQLVRHLDQFKHQRTSQ